MKRTRNALVLGLITTLSFGTINPLPAAEVSVGVNVAATADFYAPLTPVGTWVEIHDYGRCWRPASVTVGWRPYCDGDWVWTDCGWYWESDEPWAWACYHYGTWVYADDYWYWVPGIEWSPAWVYWRVGGGYCGWAPYPPHGRKVAEADFVFVDDHHFTDHHNRAELIVNDPKIAKQTKEITKIRRERREINGKRERVVVNNGPGVKPFQKATGKKFTPQPVTQISRRTYEHAPADVRRRRDPSPTETKSPANAAPKKSENPPARDEHRSDRHQKPPQTPPEPEPAPEVKPNEPPTEKSLPPEQKIPPKHSAPPFIPPSHDQAIPHSAPEAPPGDALPNRPPAKDVVPEHATPDLPPEHREAVSPSDSGPAQEHPESVGGGGPPHRPPNRERRHVPSKP